MKKEDSIEWETQYTRVSLKNLYSYTTNFSLSNLRLVMEVGYNSRAERRWISLKSAGGSIILPRTFLNAQTRVYPNINMNLLGYSCFIILEPKDERHISEDLENWADNFWLTFVGWSQDCQEDMEKGFRVVTVGN